MFAITLRTIKDEDYMMQATHGYKDIPKGEAVKVLRLYRNLYGEYADVEYKGIVYSTKPEYLKRKAEKQS